MGWLSHNWIWLLLAAGVFWPLLCRRQGERMAGCGSHGLAHGDPPGGGETPGVDAAGPAARVATADQVAARAAIERYRRDGGCC